MSPRVAPGLTTSSAWYRHSWVIWMRRLAWGAHLSHLHHDAGIPVVAVLDHGHIDIDDVAVFQFAAVGGDAVADHVVDRGADRAGEAIVVKRGRDGLLGAGNVVVADPVQLAGGHPDLHQRFDHFQHFCGETPRDPHLVNLIRGLDRYCHL